MSPDRPVLICEYRYDPLDRLINHARPSTPTLQRFYCKSRLATEIQGLVLHSIVQHGDQLLGQQRREGNSIDNTLLATDRHRTVLHTLARPAIGYMPYGHRVVDSGLANLLGFIGERPDAMTGHYVLGNGYRFFNPVLMRFNSPDSWSPFGSGGLNSYAYCLGDPINFADPTGHMVSVLILMKKVSDRFGSRKNPDPNLLEGMHSHVFNNVTQYLDRVDMDNLSQVSRQVSSLSKESSVSNLKTYLVSHSKHNRLLRPDLSSSTPGVDETLSSPGLPDGRQFPVLKGVTSATLKKIDSSIKGPKTLVKYSHEIRDVAAKEIGSDTFSSYTDWEQKVNARHIDQLLQPFEI